MGSYDHALYSDYSNLKLFHHTVCVCVCVCDQLNNTLIEFEVLSELVLVTELPTLNNL